jgi:hypothetical protein
MLKVPEADGRTIQFEGELLAQASSHRVGADRWVDLALYRTNAGSYVVSRIGQSVLYHAEGCPVVRKGRHVSAQVATLTANSRPCPVCKPKTDVDFANEVIYPERPLYFARVCQDADGVLESLSKRDESGDRYFTHIARELIHVAAMKDVMIGDAYYVETVL